MGKVHFVVVGRMPRHRGGSESAALAFRGDSGLSCLVTFRGTQAHPGVKRWLCRGALRGAQGTAVRGPGAAAVQGAAHPRCPRCCRRRETSWRVPKALSAHTHGAAEVHCFSLSWAGQNFVPSSLSCWVFSAPSAAPGWSACRTWGVQRPWLLALQGCREQLEQGISPGLSTQPAHVCGSQFPQSALAQGTYFYCTLHPFRTCEQRRNTSFSGAVGIVGSAGYANLPAYFSIFILPCNNLQIRDIQIPFPRWVLTELEKQISAFYHRVSAVLPKITVINEEENF